MRRRHLPEETPQYPSAGKDASNLGDLRHAGLLADRVERSAPQSQQLKGIPVVACSQYYLGTPVAERLNKGVEVLDLWRVVHIDPDACVRRAGRHSLRLAAIHNLCSGQEIVKECADRCPRLSLQSADSGQGSDRVPTRRSLKSREGESATIAIKPMRHRRPLLRRRSRRQSTTASGRACADGSHMRAGTTPARNSLTSYDGVAIAGRCRGLITQQREPGAGPRRAIEQVRRRRPSYESDRWHRADPTHL